MPSSSKTSVVLAEPVRTPEIEVLPRVSHVLEHLCPHDYAFDIGRVFSFPHTQLLNKSAVHWHIAAMVLANPIASKNNINVIWHHVTDWRDALHIAMASFNRENASIAKKLSLPLWSKASYRQLSGLLEDKKATKLLRHADMVTPEFVAKLYCLNPQLRIHQVLDHLAQEDEAMLIAKMFGRLSDDHQMRLVDSLKAASSRQDIWKKLRTAFISANGDFPTPPEINDPRIKPILSFDQLSDVSKTMKNCLGGFGHAEEALSGEAAYYAFNGDEKAVIQIEPRFGGNVITDIGGVSNKPLSDEVLKIIKQIFANHGLGDETKSKCHWSTTIQCQLRNLANEDEATSHCKHLVEELLQAVEEVPAL